MKYIYHLGVHKTASALLQRNLQENLDELRAQGVFYVNAEMPRIVRKQFRLLAQLHAQPDNPPPVQPFRRMNRMLENVAQEAGAHTVLTSGADLIGAPMHHDLANAHGMPAFYPGAAAAMAQLTTGVAPRDVEALIYCRNPETYLLSLYSDAIRQGLTTMDLSAFCASVDLETIDFGRLKQRLQSTLPEARITMRQYERIKLGAEPYISTFLRDVGLNASYAQPVMVPQLPPLDQSQVDALRHIAFGDTSRRPQRIKRLRNRILSHAPNPGDPLILPDWVRNTLRRETVEDRRRA